MEVDPADLGPDSLVVLSSTLAKKLPSQYGKTWTDKLEFEMQKICLHF